MPEDPAAVAAYLHALRDLRATGAGVKETTYYPPLAVLLESVGASLKPAVRPVGQLKNFLGAGSPDFGFFAADQFPKRADLTAPAPSVFSTENNREGIQVGTAVTTLVRTGMPDPAAAVRFRHFWGKEKRAELEACAEPFDPAAYVTLAPPAALGLPFVPVSVGEAWLTWPRLPELLPANSPGVKTSRDDFLVAVDRGELERRITDYFNDALSDEEIARRYPGVMDSTARFDARAVRAELRKRGPGNGFIVRLAYRPFDVRWLYWEPETKLLDEKRADYFAQVSPTNLWIFTTGRTRKDNPEPAIVTPTLADLNLMDSGSRGFPAMVRDAAILGGSPGEPRPNLSPAAHAYLARFGRDADADAVPPDSLFFHAVATLHAPAYRTENAGALRQDWPRIPLPADRGALLASAALGRRVTALLDPETPVPGVTAGPLPEDLRHVAVLTKTGGKPLDPATDLAVTAGWGHFGQGGAVMPGRGKMTTPWLVRPVPDPTGLFARTVNIHLNEAVYWAEVPVVVWEFTLGGYPVLKKWLSYRESAVLGRTLRPEEAREFTAIARRVAALLQLGPDLDAAYRSAATSVATP